tara:strand:+ start:15767 stop:16831 length:1065 start_codon:yes stop_codon:yes gene_type:complete
MSLHNKIPTEARGRFDKPCSSLDAPKYAPYKDGRGTLDVGMKPIEKEEVFQVDRFWPYYMSRKHWLLAYRRNIVYRDINKKKTLNSHIEFGIMPVMLVMDLDLPFDAEKFENPNWDKEWDRYQNYSSTFAPDRTTMLEAAKYLCYYGGPPVDMWSNMGNKYGLEHLTRIVQEDVCVLRRREEGWILIAGSVCFPSYWSLKQKMGRPLQEVHASVPQMTEAINDVITKKMDDLESEKSVERFNWTMTNDRELHQPYPERTYKSLGGHKVSNANDGLYVRVERQTLTKLPANGDIMFTIRTYINPLAAIIRDITLAKGLHSAIINSSKEVLSYRGISIYRSEILECLDERIINESY